MNFTTDSKEKNPDFLKFYEFLTKRPENKNFLYRMF